jgi:hypothetical protein
MKAETVHRLDLSVLPAVSEHWVGDAAQGGFVRTGPAGEETGTPLPCEVAKALGDRETAQCGPLQCILRWPVVEAEPPREVEPVLTWRQRTYTPDHTYRDLEERGLA